MRAKKKLNFIDRIILSLNILLCAGLIISYFSPYINPKTAWQFAFFGLAYPFLLTANIILVIYWLFRRKRLVLISLACILIGWNILLNNVEFHLSALHAHPDPVQSGIRIMTYNVHNFKRYGAANDISTKHEILAIINEQHPDIIGFQEFYTRGHGQYDMRDSILKIMGSGFYYFEPEIFNKTEAIGIAIFSKYPIINRGAISISGKSSENACIYVDVKKGQRTFRFYTVHLQSIRFDPEDYKYIESVTGNEKPADGNKTSLSSARRLGSKLKTAFIKRSIQVAAIKKQAGQCPYPYIISGDFNDTPSSFAVNSMADGLKNAFREKGFGLGRTYNGDFPNYQIDYIMTSGQFDIADYRVIEKKLSDHYPVRSDVILQ